EWLVQRERDGLAAGRTMTGAVTLRAATQEQRRAVERLTGRAARSGTSLSVSLPEVDRILRDSGAAPGGLAEAVTRLTGPLRDRNRERADLAAAWGSAVAPLDPAVAGRDELGHWRGRARTAARPAWCAVSPPTPVRRGRSSPRPRRCSGGYPHAASLSDGSPPNAAATLTPWTTDARSARSCCRRSVRWRACRSRRRELPTP